MINQNFISVDKKTARNSYGDFFEIGDIVEHQDKTTGKAIISSFEIDVKMNEIKAFTSKGYAALDFISKTQ